MSRHVETFVSILRSPLGRGRVINMLIILIATTTLMGDWYGYLAEPTLLRLILLIGQGVLTVMLLLASLVHFMRTRTKRAWKPNYFLLYTGFLDTEEAVALVQMVESDLKGRAYRISTSLFGFRYTTDILMAKMLMDADTIEVVQPTFRSIIPL